MSNSKSVWSTLGASNHSELKRIENDFYATDPKAVEQLLMLELFDKDILEPCVGQGHIAEVLKDWNKNVTCYDIVDRGYEGTVIKDFFTLDEWNGDIITNPPYKQAREFVEHALDIVDYGNKVAMLLKIQFLESMSRRELFRKYPPCRIYVASKRVMCARDGREELFSQSSAACYCWFVWVKGYTGEPVVRWFNDGEI